MCVCGCVFFVVYCFENEQKNYDILRCLNDCLYDFYNACVSFSQLCNIFNIYLCFIQTSQPNRTDIDYGDAETDKGGDK